MAIGNSVNDEIKAERQKLVGKTKKEKFNYFIEYYKFHTIAILVASILIILFARDLIMQKDTVMSAIYVNGFPNVDTEEIMVDFSSYLGIDDKKEDVLLDASYYLSADDTSEYTYTYIQKIVVMVAAGSLDAFVADEDYFVQYALQGYFYDLSTILSAEQLETYQDNLIYVDVPDDDNDQAVPVGVRVTDANKIVDTASYPNSEAYLGVVASSNYVENALAFLAYLFE